MFPELEISTTITDPETQTPITITGCADWAFGYGLRGGQKTGPFLVVIKAKTRYTLFAAEPQLLAYLAMIQQQRAAAGKTNTDVQGFFTDGGFYVFVAIRANGVVERSRVLDIKDPVSRKTIFNFVVTILESAIKSSPSTMPTESIKRQQKEIFSFKKEVWENVYMSYDRGQTLEEEDQYEGDWE